MTAAAHTLKPWQVEGAEALRAKSVALSRRLDGEWEGIDTEHEFETPTESLARLQGRGGALVEIIAEWANNELCRDLPEGLEQELRDLRDECRSLARWIQDERRASA